MDRFSPLFSPTRRVVAVNTISQLIGKAVSAAATFVFTVVVAREFGADGYGDFVKVTTYAAFFYLVADFGINAIFLQDKNQESAWSTLLYVRTVGGLALVLVSLLLLFFLPGTSAQGYTPFVRMGILIFSPTILFQSLITTANAMFQKKLRYDLSTWSLFFGSLVSLLTLWIFIRFGSQTTMLPSVFATLAGTIVTSLAAIFFAVRLSGQTQYSISAESIKRLVIPALPLGVTLLFNLVYFRVDSIILTLTRSTAEVGIYGLAYKVFEVVLVFPTFFMNAVYPIMLQHENKELGIKNYEFIKIFRQSFWFLLGASIVSGIVLWFAAPLLTYIKIDFAESISALRILVVGLPLFFVSSLTMWTLIAKKQQRSLIFIYGMSMVVNVVGNFFLIPVYGYIAAAWMTVVGEGVVLLVSTVVLSRLGNSENNW